MGEGELTNASDHNHELRIDSRSGLDRTEIVSETCEQTAVVSPAVSDDSPASVTKFKVEHITSSVLAGICFILNWYSVYHGKPTYVPEFMIGLMLGGYGATAYQWIKEKLGGKQ